MNKGYKRTMLTRVANTPNGTVVSLDDLREWLPADAPPQTASQLAAELARGDNPFLRRRGQGVYEVIAGRRPGPGRPAGPKTPKPVVPQQDPAPKAPRTPVAKPVTDTELLIEWMKQLPDGSALYIDADSNIYKVAKIA